MILVSVLMMTPANFEFFGRIESRSKPRLSSSDAQFRDINRSLQSATSGECSVSEWVSACSRKRR